MSDAPEVIEASAAEAKAKALLKFWTVPFEPVKETIETSIVSVPWLTTSVWVPVAGWSKYQADARNVPFRVTPDSLVKATPL